MRNISLLRTAKIWPLTPAAASERRNTATGAILAGVIRLIFSTRAACVSSAMGIVPMSRLQAKGEMQFERTWKRAMSSAIDFESPTIPSLAAA